jgi:adenosylcobinamide-GDP ribazoletransferase
VRAVIAAFGFLTRLPVPAGAASGVEIGRSVAVFPVVGLVLGLVLAGGAFLLSGALTPLVLSVLLVALLAALTGGLHLDGLADLFDAVGGGRGDRARMLELMRDSRIGAHGAAALVLLLVAKVVALGHALERHDLVTVLVFPALARWAVVPAIVFVPYARAEGLGLGFTRSGRARDVVAATILMAAAVLALRRRAILYAAGASLSVVVLLAAWLRRRLGGLTGDVYGAAIEMAEVAALVAGGAYID